MRFPVVAGILSLAVESVYSQAAGWAQYYSQCVPGTATSAPTTLTTKTSSTKSSSSTSKPITTSTTSKPITTSTTSKSTSSISSTSKTSSSVSSTTQGACTAAFTPVTASAAIAALNPGWNLGNTLDAIPDEGSWNNPPVVAGTFAAVKAKGFKSFRIPITWTDHFVSGSPSWTVNSTWMDRVETVVDEALATGLYVLINVHHDATDWADVTASGANYTMIEEKFGSLWLQIATRMKCKSSKLLFEPINEPPGSTQAHATEINKLNSIFLDSVNKGGGYNPQRVVTLVGMNMDSALTSQYFVRPTTYPNQPWGIQFHYYSPYQFIFNAWGDTIWGSDSDKAALLSDFQHFAGNFTNIPTLIGEWQATPVYTEKAARWRYTDYFVRTAKQFGFSHQIWDNGLDALNRNTNTWYDPIEINILFTAVSGATNSLPDQSTDYTATSWNSSAYLFHQYNTPVTAQSVSYVLNGNTLSSIATSSGSVLPSTSYSISSSGVLTFTQTYLSTLFTPPATPGTKETLTLTFSSGSPLTLELVQYSTPTIPTTSYTKNANPSSDLLIPINYAGLPIVAAVKALNADGSYTVTGDAWTMYLGPLQQARWTYGSWTSSSAGLTITSAGQQVIAQSGQTVTLIVEFFPRSVGANSVNVTFT
ncbi:Endoglucanase B protein [Rutstroemia sp. NJR-2017a WRK4]|nr:Endoglucanase B protein [Rutstroemia sp. NJR-2017a WRK4]